MTTQFNLEEIKDLFIGAKREQVNINTIILGAGTQPRASVDKQAIENYTECMLNGGADGFPALSVVELIEPVMLPDGSELEIGARVLVDGFQRITAAQAAKLGTFQCDITKGTLDQAIYFSMNANSTNGVNLKGKDYQNAIKKLYTMDGGYWREHGRKQEIASLLGCATKTVERAVAAIDKATKAEAFKMFDQGASDEEVAAFAFKSEKTVQKWREEWESLKANNEPGEGNQGTNQEAHQNADENNPMDLTFNQVLSLKNKDLQRKLLQLLRDAVDANEEEPQSQPEPEVEPQPEPQESQENPEIEAIANEWKSKDWWDILELDLATLNSLKNPKAAIKRAYNKQLKRVHSDKFGENEALELLKDALAEANKMFK